MKTHILPEFDTDLADEVAFLALGAADFIRNHGAVNLREHEGYMGLIGKVICHAPLLAERWQEIGKDFEGVWLYDVTERFGREWTETLIDGADETPEQRLDYIIYDEMEKWL